MRDLDCFEALADPDRPEGEIVDWLEQLAELPLSDRWPWFARVLPWLERSRALRIAGLTALDGAVGLEARRAVVAALDDDDEAVRARAVENLAAIGRVDGHAWAHALYHRRDDVRVAALTGLGEVDLPQWAMLPLLADEVAAPRLERRLLERGLGPGSVGYLLQLMAPGGVGRAIGLRCLASLNWRHQLASVLEQTPGQRTLDGPEGSLSERIEAWRTERDDLDALVATVVAGAAEGDVHAIEVLDRWRQGAAAGGSLDEAERRLAVSLLAQPVPLPGEALALVLLAFPEAIDEFPLDVLWPALAPYAEVADGPLPSVKRSGFVERLALPGVDLLALTGLVRLVGNGAAHAVLTHPDVPREALIDAMVADPAAAARFLGVPLVARRDRSARRQLLVDALATHGPAAAVLLAHAATRIPHSQLAVIEARPDEWTDDDEAALREGFVATLLELDVQAAIRERRTRQLADLPSLHTVDVLQVILLDGRLRDLGKRLVIRILTDRGAECALELSSEALEKLVALDRYQGLLPWAVQQEFARVVQNHGHTTVQQWAADALAPVEKAMSRMSEAAPGRRLTEAEVERIRTATPKQLPTALAPALTGRVRGLVEALGERPAVPSVEACLALLLSGDRLESVGRLLEDYCDDTERFWSTLEQRAVAQFAHDDDVGLGLAAWLWRWEKPFGVFVRYATDKPDDLAFVLGRALGVPSPRLRERVWQAVRSLCRQWRWRTPAILVRAATQRFQSTVMGVFSGASVALSKGRSPRAWVANELDFAEVTRVAGGIVDAMHRLRVDLSAHREEVETRLAELPRRTVDELGAWLGLHAAAADEEPEPPSVAVPRGVDALEDPAELVQIVMKADRGYAELAALRLLEIGPAGELALAEAMAEGPGRNGGVVVEAGALVSDPDAVAVFERVLADVEAPAKVRFHVALALAEGEQRPDLDAVGLAAGALALELAEDERSWLDSARFERWLARLPEDPEEVARYAEWLVTSPHFPAYRWAVARHLEPAFSGDPGGLERFLRLGRSRNARVRVDAAAGLARGKQSLGAPLLAAWRMEQVRNKETELVDLAPHHASTIAKSGVIAGNAVVTPAALLEAVVATHVPGYERTRSALTILQDCDDEGVQRQALNHLDSRLTKLRLVGKLARIVVWGRDQARELLERDFGVQLIGGESLGYTRLEQDRVYVNPLPLLRGDRNGSAVLRGLLVHELGHHLYNADEQGLAVWKRAGEMRLQRLHNLVCDEHLERNLRARRSSYDTVLKRLAAWAFLHTRTEIPVTTLIERMGTAVARLIATDLEVARKARHVSIDMGQLFRRLEAEGSSFARFVRALRMGLGNRHGDPLVEQGLALFGKDFRHLDNEGLWKVTLAVRDLFGQEVDLMDLVDLHETTTGGDGEAIAGGRGITDGEVQERADDLVRVRERPQGGGSGAGPGGGPDVINVGDDVDFDRIDHIVTLSHDPVAHGRIARDVSRPANQLRASLVDLGLAFRTVKPRTSGYRIDRSRLVSAALRRDPRILVNRVRVPSNDLFVGVVVDCSGSMGGERLERAKRFATLIAVACQGLPSVDVRIFGFTDRTLYDAGTASRCAAHALEVGGGNNDAAALYHVGTLARRSPRDAKLLVMISDGLPTECSSTSLIALVRRLEREGMACAQVAVAPIREPCFDHYVEVLGDDSGDVVRRFGRIVQNLVAAALRAGR